MFTSTGQGFLGYNMFAYCNNAPTKTIDLSGCLPQKITDEPIYYIAEPDRSEDITALVDSDYYSKETWQGLTPREQRQRLQEFFEDAASILGIEGLYLDVGVDSEQLYTHNGYYSHSQRKVFINSQVFHFDGRQPASYTSLKTVLHELRHAYQHAVIDGAVEMRYPNESLIQMWQYDYSNYKSPQYGFPVYMEQFVEVDARRFSQMFF